MFLGWGRGRCGAEGGRARDFTNVAVAEVAVPKDVERRARDAVRGGGDARDLAACF